MPYRLLLMKPIDQKSRTAQVDVYLDNLPTDYKVYLFYYPSPVRNNDLENKLRSFGNNTDRNLFINIGSLRDPKYNKIARDFEIRDLPVIIITAISKLASVGTEAYCPTVYVRIDSKYLLKDTNKAIELVSKVFNLFISGRVLEALQQARLEQQKAFLSYIKDIIIKGLKEIAGHINEKDISISLLEGKLEVKGTE